MKAHDRIRALLAKHPMKLVLPEGDDDRILQAAVALPNLAPISPVVLGDRDALTRAGSRLGIGLEKVEIRALRSTEDVEAFAAAYIRGRPETALSLARRIVSKPLYHAGMLVRTGHADAMLAGVSCATSKVIEAALLTIGLAPGVETASSCFLMNVADVAEQGARSMVFADCAVNVDPPAEVLADIAIASARSLREFTGEEPRIAFLSFSTHGSARHSAVDRVRAAVDLTCRRAPWLAVDGELQADAAVSLRTAALKLSGPGAVAGRANVLIFPDLNAANIGYKLVQYLGGATAIGPILQGFSRPVSDLSRGATVADVIETALYTAARAVLPQE